MRKPESIIIADKNSYTNESLWPMYYYCDIPSVAVAVTVTTTKETIRMINAEIDYNQYLMETDMPKQS